MDKKNRPPETAWLQGPKYNPLDFKLQDLLLIKSCLYA